MCVKRIIQQCDLYMFKDRIKQISCLGILTSWPVLAAFLHIVRVGASSILGMCDCAYVDLILSLMDLPTSLIVSMQNTKTRFESRQAYIRNYILDSITYVSYGIYVCLYHCVTILP